MTKIWRRFFFCLAALPAIGSQIVAAPQKTQTDAQRAQKAQQSVSDQEAKRFIEDTVSGAKNLVKSGASSEKFGQFMKGRCAISLIARYVLAAVKSEYRGDKASWPSFLAQHSSAFVDSFAKRVVSTYSTDAKREVFGKSSFKILDQVFSKEGKPTRVKTIFYFDGTPTSIEWYLIKDGGNVLIQNLVIEEISMLLSERRTVKEYFKNHAKGGKNMNSFFQAYQSAAQ